MAILLLGYNVAQSKENASWFIVINWLGQAQAFRTVSFVRCAQCLFVRPPVRIPREGRARAVGGGGRRLTASALCGV